MLGTFESDEAQQRLDILMRLQPGFDLAYVDATYPFRRSEDRAHFIGGLEAAGWQAC